jgi:hypothetical protein
MRRSRLKKHGKVVTKEDRVPRVQAVQDVQTDQAVKDPESI